jgi:hypothetical protein
MVTADANTPASTGLTRTRRSSLARATLEKRVSQASSLDQQRATQRPAAVLPAANAATATRIISS